MLAISRKAASAALALASIAALGAAARAGSVNFDLEDQATSSSGSMTTLDLSKDGISFELAKNGESFGIIDLSAQSGTTSFGARSLQPGVDGNSVFTINFPNPVSSVSVQYGDFGGKADALFLTGFSGANGTGTNLGSATGTLPAIPETFVSQTLQVTAAGISSVQFEGGAFGSSPTAGPMNNSVFYDNIGVTTGSTGGGSAVPLPPALWMAPLGALAAIGAGRRLRKPRIA